MPSDYEQICADNIRAYGEETHHLAFFGKLYSDRTHFIFELLQNAEDAEAKNVLFRLLPNRLDVLHDGQIFSGKDVRGICGIAERNKADDLTKIGKFGVGFKSVYSYVDGPEIHSGDEHFRIESYIRPRGIPSEVPEEDFTTLFRLPFRGAPTAVATAVKEIEAALRSLSPTTLLFLRNIESVQFHCGERPIPQLKRTAPPLSQKGVRKVTLEPSDASLGEGVWLLFERPITLQSDDGKSHELRVELAFRARSDGASVRLEIIPVPQSRLVVFFPTAIPTNLGFYIQGPYRTTPARENIHSDDASNQNLVRETAALVIQSLRWLKENGMLTASALGTLPIHRNQFPSDGIFRPIFERVLEAIRTEAFLPASGDTNGDHNFVAGCNARVVRSATLRKLLTPSQLTQLCASTTPLNWIADEISNARHQPLWSYLREDVKIEEVAAKDLVLRLTPEFLLPRSDEWLANFYSFLGSQQEWLKAYRHGKRDAASVPFIDKPIIRLGSGAHVSVRKPDGRLAAYLPPDGHPTGFPCVKREVIATQEAEKFLSDLGFHLPDETDDILENILPKYAIGSIPEADEYQSDLKQIFDALNGDSMASRQRLSASLRTCVFLKAKNAGTGTTAAKCPAEVHLRSPELECYFFGNTSVWFLSSECDDFRNEIRSLGAPDEVPIKFRQPDDNGHVIVEREHGRHRRGLEEFDPGFTIPDLEHALKRQDFDCSAFIWNRLLRPHSKLLRGEVEDSRHQNYTPSTKLPVFSPAGRLATTIPWLPNRSGRFCRAEELSLSDLPDAFTRDEMLSNQLGMKQTVASITSLAERIGVPTDMLEYLRQNKITMGELEQFKQWRDRRTQGSGKSETAPDLLTQPPASIGHHADDEALGSTSRTTDDHAPRAEPPRPEYSSSSESRPHPHEGLEAQEWLRQKLAQSLDSAIWQISQTEQATPGDRGRTDVLISHLATGRKFYLEVKRIEGRKVYWSERQIALARAHTAHYFVALLKPSRDDDPYDVYWVWNPLDDFETCQRRVQWTWKESAEGEFCPDWQPAGEKPSKDADSFRALIEVSDEFITGLPSGVLSLRSKIEPAAR